MAHEANQVVDQWLAGEQQEEVLEPELPIVDPHHHLWDIRRYDNEPHASFEQKVYLCEEIADDIRSAGHRVEKTVFAQCGAFYRADGPEHMKCVGETEFVQGIVAMSRSGLYGEVELCAGIFGAADLRMGAGVEEVLRAHMRASPNFRGIRAPFPDDLNDDFMHGLDVLARLGLSYDNWSPDFDRLPTLARLAAANPEVTVIVNHLGGKVDVNAPRDVIRRWQQGIDAVAACGNAVMKCGGAQMRVGAWEPDFHMHQRGTPLGSEALAERLLPFYQYVIEAFGPERCMFESNFPVDRECVSYRTLWNMFKRIARQLGLSEAEKSAMFKDTAVRVYRL